MTADEEQQDLNEPWSMRPGESARAYEAFRVYRDLGKERSLRAAALEFYGRENPGAVRQMGDWSTRWGWVDRVRAYEEEQDRIYREKAAEELREMGERHARLAVAMLGKAARRLQSIPDSELGPRDITAFVAEASRLERLARGQAADTVEHRGVDGEALTVVLALPEKRRPDTDEETDDE